MATKFEIIVFVPKILQFLKITHSKFEKNTINKQRSFHKHNLCQISAKKS